MERYFGMHQIRYAGRLAGIMLITSLFSCLSAQEPVRLKVMTYNLRFGELSSLKNIADFIEFFRGAG